MKRLYVAVAAALTAAGKALKGFAYDCGELVALKMERHLAAMGGIRYVINQLGDGNTGEGAQVGVSGGKVGFYGTTPIALRASASQATSLLSTASSTAIDTLTKAAIIEIMNALAAIGMWKGSA